MVGFVEAVRLAFQNYKDFETRSRRSEFWWFQLALILGSLAVGVIDTALGYDPLESAVTPMALIFILVTILPSAAVSARRLHDVGLTGWAQLPLYITYIGYIPGYERFLMKFETGPEILLGLVFMVYAIWILLQLIKDSQPGTNKYGRNPKDVDVPRNFD